MRSNDTYRSTRRNQVREILKKVRKNGLKLDGRRPTFRDAFAEAQENWTRIDRLPRVVSKPFRPTGQNWRGWPDLGKQEAARRLARKEVRVNG